MKKLSDEILSAAIEGLEAQKSRLDEKIVEVRQWMGGRSVEPAATATKPVGKSGKRTMSAATRAKMAAAQQKRWAGKKKASDAAPAKSAPAKAKRKMSAAGRKKIADAAKRRWADIRAAKAA